MKCAKCGAEIRPGCVYCSNCGQEAQIVTEINKRADAREIWNELYDALVAPCVKLIQCGEMERARKLYREMSLSLKERYM